MIIPARRRSLGIGSGLARQVGLLVLVVLGAAACRSKPIEDDIDGGPPLADQGEQAGTGPASKVPVDTLVSLTLGDPESLDPAWTYESQGVHVDAQIYEGLVAFEREHPDRFVPALATAWQLSEDQKTYTFTLRPGVTFHEGGTLEPNDVAYSLQRALLQDRGGGPMWMLLKAFTGQASIAELTAAQLQPPPEAGKAPALADLPAEAKAAACAKVQAAVQADDAAGTVTLHLAAPTPWFLQLLSIGSGAGTLDREWMVQQGDWDGDCGSWERWHDPAAQESVLYDRANGTGPYRLVSWKKTEAVRLDANPNHWRKEPAWTGAPDGPAAIGHVVIETVPEWGTRYTRLKAGEADRIDVPLPESKQLADLVQTEYQGGDESAPATVVNPNGFLKLFRGYLVNSASAGMFNQRINTDAGTAYLGSGRLDGEGIPPDFFGDKHVRLGFNHCFDWDTYLKDGLQGEGIRQRGPIVKGEDGYEADAPIYDFDLKACEAELGQAWGGKLPETGFKMTLAYLDGQVEFQLFCEILADGLARVNPKYRLDSVKQEWPTLLDNMNNRRLPIATVGWYEDYHDASNWAFAYLHSRGTYGGLQGWPAELATRLDGLVDQAAVETDAARRKSLYAELQRLAMSEVTGIYLQQALGRHYWRKEVEGSYVNSLVPGGYYAVLRKTGP